MRYHIDLFWSDEDKCWIADIPDLKFCSAHGETPAEALREVQVAKKVAQQRQGPQATRPEAHMPAGDLRVKGRCMCAT